jgi:hypothetical protein
MAPARLGCSLNDRDRFVAQILSRKIRLATAGQLARALWGNGQSALDCSRRRLSSLVSAGRLRSFQVLARPEREVVGPLWIWTPGDPQPPFGVLSYQAKIRWTESIRPMTVFTASERSAKVYAGSGGRLSHPLQATHDIHVSAIFFKLLRENPEEAEWWVSDEVLAPLRRRQKLPDAEIHDALGRTVRVIEFAGGYPPERIRKVHEDCERRQVPYELW